MNQIRYKYVKRISIAIIAVFIVGIFLIRSDSVVINWAMAITNPLVKAGDNLYMSVKSVFTIKDIVSENVIFSKENLKLVSENVRLKEIEKENIALKKQLGISAEMERKTIRANVCGFDPLNSDSFLTINKGSQDGVQEGLPVLSEDGVLVGKINYVEKSFSRVLLVFSSKSSIAAITQSSRVAGIVQGDFGISLMLDMIPQFEEVEIGEMIITSGIGGIFPKAIPIGNIAGIDSSSSEVFKKAEIDSLINPRRLENVIILLND